MKSFLSMLPLAGLALAQGQCATGITVTETSIERITVTVKATSYAAPSAIVTPNTKSEEAKPSHTPQVPYYPIGNGTFNSTSRFATHTPHAPTTLQTETFVFPTSVVPSSSTKKVKTVYVVPSPVDATSAATVATSASAAPAQSSAAASPVPDTAAEDTTSAAGSVKGTASFYGGNLAGGACSFSGYTLPSNLFGTAFGGSWDASQCGTCVSVTGPNGKTIKAMVVDQCPECASNKLDLFENAFTQIGQKSAGIIDISYAVVPCGITSPIVLKNKEGTSPYWFSMQVQNSNVAISKLEVSTDGGSSWKATTRQPYNYFENSSGFGTSSVDVRVTATNGKSIVVKGVSVAASTTKTAGSNFS
ncbi:hypothetical protein N0V90_001875 [Kalmusia sp. IMI 367209]|nr:hypothetical protein N0V90_001875 [Kalmusia sp. IMI 367209]